MLLHGQAGKEKVMTKQKTQEIAFKAFNGWAMLFLYLLFLAATALCYWQGAIHMNIPLIILAAVMSLVVLIWPIGFFIVNPNVSRALILFGRYRGTVLENGFFWTNPFTVRKVVSLRLRNLNTETLKVNDQSGSPIEIAAIVVWKVQDTAHALFDVDDYVEYVNLQCESAVRDMASKYPYDAEGAEILSLRGSREEVAEELRKELGDRLEHAGIEVMEARISHLAYAPEIAGAMLRRQQADAVIAARQKIVDGAVGMVEMALTNLKNQGVLELDEERRAAMVSNLMVVLCSEQSTQPVVNTGTLYG
jgi:regulator of protease activity HflC (stomatin/prohibitin superfamily)